MFPRYASAIALALLGCAILCTACFGANAPVPLDAQATAPPAAFYALDEAQAPAIAPAPFTITDLERLGCIPPMAAGEPRSVLRTAWIAPEIVAHLATAGPEPMASRERWFASRDRHILRVTHARRSTSAPPDPGGVAART